MQRVYGNSDAAKQALSDMHDVAHMEASDAAITCKRAALLYAVYREPEVRDHFECIERGRGEAVTRAVVLTTPLFEKTLCQTPDEYVLACAVLSDMWAGEQFGRVKLTTTPPDES